MCAYAVPRADGSGCSYRHFGDRGFVELHMLDHPIVDVLLAEDAGGQYYAWIDSDKDRPSLVWGDRLLFAMCFPGDPWEMERGGKGRVLRLSVNLAGGAKEGV